MEKLLFILSIKLILLTSCTPQDNSLDRKPASLDAETTARHWSLTSGALPLTLGVSTNFSTTEKNAIASIINEWNTDGTSINIIHPTLNEVPPIDTGDLKSFRDGTLGIYKVEDWFDEVGSSALAVTQFFAYPTQGANGLWYYEVVHADIMVNYQDHFFSNDPSPYSFEYDLRSVVLHELGHLIGLGHVSDFSVPSVMHPTLSLGQKKRSLYDIDIENIEKLYNTSSVITSLAPIDTPRGEIVRGLIELRKDGKCKHHYYHGAQHTAHIHDHSKEHNHSSHPVYKFLNNIKKVHK
jgi:hypothetical protein